MKHIKKVIALVLVLALVAAAYLLGNGQFSNTKSSDAPAPKTTIRVLKDGFKNQGKLVTQEYYFTMAVQYSNNNRTINLSDKQFTIPFTESHFLYTVDGYVNAYINFEDIKFEKDGDKIIVLIPKSQLETPTVDMKTRKVYDEKNNIFHKIAADEVLNTVEELQTKATNLAKKKGVLDRADKHAVELIQSMVDQLLKTANADTSIKVECVIV